MSAVLHVGYILQTYAQGTTHNNACGDSQVQSLTPALQPEAGTVWTCKQAGVWSLMACRIVSSTLGGGSTLTLNSRKNSANGGMTTGAITASGEYADGVNTDSVAVSDTWCMQWVTTAGTGSIKPIGLAQVFTPTSGTMKLFSQSGMSAATAGTAAYAGLTGYDSNNATESSTQLKFQVAGTLQNLQVYVNAYTRTDTPAMTTRIGGANGNLTTGAINATGPYQDNVNTDPVSVSNLVNTAIPAGSGSGHITTTSTYISFVPTASGQFYLATAATNLVNNVAVLSANTTYYAPVGGGTAVSSGADGTTELSNQAQARIGFTASNLGVNVYAITMSTNTGVFLRQGGVSSLLGGANLIGQTTGIYEDNVNAVAVASTDEINHIISPGVTGTSVTLTGLWMVGNSTPPAPITGQGAGALWCDFVTW